MKITLIRTKCFSGARHKQPFEIEGVKRVEWDADVIWDVCGESLRRFYRRLTGKTTVPKNRLVFGITKKPRDGAIKVRHNGHSIAWTSRKQEQLEITTTTLDRWIEGKYGEGTHEVYVRLVEETNEVPK